MVSHFINSKVKYGCIEIGSIIVSPDASKAELSQYVNAHLDPILTHQAFFKKLERKFGVAEKLPAAIKPH